MNTMFQNFEIRVGRTWSKKTEPFSINFLSSTLYCRFPIDYKLHLKYQTVTVTQYLFHTKYERTGCQKEGRHRGCPNVSTVGDFKTTLMTKTWANDIQFSQPRWFMRIMDMFAVDKIYMHRLAFLNFIHFIPQEIGSTPFALICKQLQWTDCALRLYVYMNKWCIDASQQPFL